MSLGCLGEFPMEHSQNTLNRKIRPCIFIQGYFYDENSQSSISIDLPRLPRLMDKYMKIKRNFSL
jgi:hypothetical protein